MSNSDYRIIPIIENDTEYFYSTNADFESINKAAYYAYNIKDFIDYIEGDGYEIIEHNFSIKINFDEK